MVMGERGSALEVALILLWVSVFWLGIGIVVGARRFPQEAPPRPTASQTAVELAVCTAANDYALAAMDSIQGWLSQMRAGVEDPRNAPRIAQADGG